jgi:hypothetical protein
LRLSQVPGNGAFVGCLIAEHLAVYALKTVFHVSYVCQTLPNSNTSSNSRLDGSFGLAKGLSAGIRENLQMSMIQ